MKYINKISHQIIISLSVLVLPLPAFSLTNEELEPMVEAQNSEAIKAGGPEVIPQLVTLYSKGDLGRRTKLASIFYSLGWKSEEAKAALMQDIKTDNEPLRLQVQWALGRVSNDDEVVSNLLTNMRTDPNPLFRDKAACALANDQIHLTDKQKAKLYEGVIEALGDEKNDVRRIAGLVMQIQTGQTKGYNPQSGSAERERSINAWKSWLVEYKKAITDEK